MPLGKSLISLLFSLLKMEGQYISTVSIPNAVLFKALSFAINNPVLKKKSYKTSPKQVLRWSLGDIRNRIRMALTLPPTAEEELQFAIRFKLFRIHSLSSACS